MFNSMKPRTVEMLELLQKSYIWKADRYREDAKEWKESGKLNLANYYRGRAKECTVMVGEINDIIDSLKIM